MSERQQLEPKVGSAGLNAPVYGACIARRDEDALLVDRYLQQPINNCSLWGDGFYWEPAGADCPHCQQGFMAITRRWNGKDATISLQCSRYPDCNFSPPRIYIDAMCPTCNVRLVLDVEQDLFIVCEQCRNYTTAPVTLLSRPYFVNLRGNCPHGIRYGICITCATSAAEGGSEVEQQLAASVERTVYLLQREAHAERERQALLERQRTQPVVQGYEPNRRQSLDEENDIIWIPASEKDELYDFEYIEFWQELEQELAEYNVGSARSVQEGWFYDDNDNEDLDCPVVKETDHYHY